MPEGERGGGQAPETGQIRGVGHSPNDLIRAVHNTSANVVTEGGRRVSAERGGRATEAGEGETLPEAGGGAHGEEKGVALVTKRFKVWCTAAHQSSFFPSCQRLEEIMKRTRRSEPAEKVSAP